MYKKNDIVFCKKDFFDTIYYHEGSEFVVEVYMYEDNLIMLKSKTDKLFILELKKTNNHKPINGQLYFNDLFYSKMELRRLKIEKVMKK